MALTGRDPIEHVIVLMLENNSFDRMLGRVPGVEGIDPGNLRSNPDFPRPNPVVQAPTTERTMNPDPEHEFDDVRRQIAGPCEGFVADFAQHYPQTNGAQRAEIMGYFEHGFLSVLHGLADSFAVCDHWFSSLPGPTWPNRFFAHSGTSLGHVKMPNGIFHPNLHFYDQPTVYQRLSERNVNWAIYYGDFPQSIVLNEQLRFLDHYHRMETFWVAVAGPPDEFPAYSFIEPTYFGANQNDQHPPSDVLAGEALIANIYNTLRTNTALWQKTLLVILYDEHGGFYDHVEPPPAVAPDNHTKEFAFNQYGPRVPALLISPWLDRQIIKDVFDHTSLLKYAQDKWGLGDLGLRVAQADHFGRYLAIRETPRTDTPALLPVPASTSTAETPNLNANQNALVGFSRTLETKIADQLGNDAEALREIGARLVDSIRHDVDYGKVALQRVERFLGLAKA